jgi:hypothetical protein
MNRLFSVFLPSLLFFVGIMAGLHSACTTDKDNIPDMTNTGINDSISNQSAGGPMKIRVGSSTFTATLANNATATAFRATLPITINMAELNGNEKYFDLPSSLPARASNPGTINTGELMLYGSSTLVLFYKTFPTSYGYTPIARIGNPAGLATALGSGKATVTFELE